MRSAPAALLLAAACLQGCASRDLSQYGQPTDTATLRIAGASAPGPLYNLWAAEYAQVDASTRVVYASSSSSAGQAAVIGGKTEMGATDDPLTDEALGGRHLLHIPATLSAVGVAYHLADGALPPGVPLRLSPDLVAGILSGGVSRWDDPGIRALNPDAKLSATGIRVVVRTGESGVSKQVNQWLLAAAPAWKKTQLALNTLPAPPRTGVGVADFDQALRELAQENTLGIVPFASAVSKKLPMAALKNRAGRFVAPSLDAMSSSAAARAAQSADLRVSLIDAPGEGSYPIVAFTYLVVEQNWADARTGQALAQFLWWATHDGQHFAPGIGYATLPAEALIRTESALFRLTAGGAPAIAR
jgi:phosphate transport system substrate-binding protein